MKTYWNNLKEHPGVPLASLMSLLCPLAGMTNKSFSILHGAIFGLCLSILIWIPVLITNYTNNKNPKS